MLTEVIDVWLHGYCLARAIPPPNVVPQGFWIEVAKPQQSGRYILRCFDEGAITSLIAKITEPAVYIEVPASRVQVLSILPKGWSIRDDAYLMSISLGEFAEPETGDLAGYIFVQQSQDGVTTVDVRTPSAEVVGSGRFATSGDTAVFDQISVEPAHQRRGVGSAIMRQLSRRAASQNHINGLLVATEEGRALYAALGWRLLSDIVSIISRF